MNIVKKFLYGNNRDIEKNSILWNMFASLLNAILSALLLLIVTRIIGIVEAGIFSIATTIAYQMVSIGHFNMRNYQVTDIKENNTFKEYLYSRYITCILMVCITVMYIYIKNYDINKSLVIFGFVLFKGIDAIEDVFHGRFQQKGRLDIAGRSQTIRCLLSILFFSLMVFLTKNLLFTCYSTFVFSLILFCFLNLGIISDFKDTNSLFDFSNIKKLLISCFPLFASGYLYLYICNTPKYAIDNVLTSEMQTIFGILFMPVFTINLLSTLIYRPMLTPLANKLTNNDIHGFFGDMKKQLFIIFGITVVIFIGTYLFGIPLLSFVYNIDLSKYKESLMILMLGGGMNAIVGYLLCIITILRRQKLVLFCYGMVGLIAYFVSDIIVINYQILGASILYILLMSLLAFQLVSISSYTVFQMKNIK